jgi:hypothetical protein
MANHVNDLVGKTCTRVFQDGNQAIYFDCSDGTNYKMCHLQDCCEDVYIEDVCGDLQDLVGVPIVQAEENCNSSFNKEEDYESSTWTFYNIATANGHVTIRWYGSSNGYYSEQADFIDITDGEAW